MKKILLSCVMLSCLLPQASNAVTLTSPDQSVNIAVGQGMAVSFDSAFETVFIADPSVASYQVVDNSKLLIFGKNPGRTSLFVMDEMGNSEYSSTVNVLFDIEPMKRALRSEFPSLNLKLTPALDGVAVSGKVPSAEIAAHIVSLLDSFLKMSSASGAPAESAEGGEGGGSESSTSGAGKGKGTMAMRNGQIINRLTITMPTQVNVQVKIAEVSKDLKEQLGFQWGYVYNNTSNLAIGLANTALTGLPGFDATQTLGGFLSSAAEAASDGFSLPDVTGMINLLSSENLVSVLAEPNLSASSGESASFLVGGEMAYVVQQADSDTTTTETKDFGIMLSMVPTVLSENKISLRLRPEVSEPDYTVGVTTGGNFIPGLKIRRVETTVELASGQSYVIGGLMSNDILDNIEKIPGIGDIPVFGALARSSRFERGETELVVIVTANIVEPSDSKLRIPNAQIYTPSAFERLLLGKKHELKPGSIDGIDFIL